MRIYGFVPREWKYMTAKESVYGYWRPVVWFVGLYHDSPIGATELLYLEMHEATFVYPDEVDPAAQPFVDV